jgi:hypothetical protein
MILSTPVTLSSAEISYLLWIVGEDDNPIDAHTRRQLLQHLSDALERIRADLHPSFGPDAPVTPW